MRTASFAEPSHELFVRGFEKPKRDFYPGLLLQFFVNIGEFAETFSLANVNNHGDLRSFIFGFQNEFVEFADKTDRQVINAEVTTVLKGPEERSLSGTTEACDDHERRRFHASGSIH